MVVYLAIGVTVGGCSSETDSPEEGLSSFMEGIHAATGFTGAVVIARWGEPVFEGGWGIANRAQGVSFTPDTPTDGASLAKTFVAAGVWQLEQDGLIDLGDPVRRYVPGYPHESTQLRNLLEHSAGIAELDDASGLTNADIAASIGLEPGFEPGSRFSYCNECFDILALVTERATGQGWGEFLEERYFGPLGMDSAFIRPALFKDWEGTRTTSYRLEDGEVIAHEVSDDEPFYGSSNVYLSARDLSKWGTALSERAILDLSTLERAEVRRVFPAGGRSPLNGLNWFQEEPGGPAYFDGHLRGFHSVLYWDASSGLVVAWVSNTLGGRPMELQLTRELVRIAEGGEYVGLPRFPATVMEGAIPYSALEGAYTVEGLGDILVSQGDGAIRVRVNGGPERPGYPSTGFYVPDLGVEIGFSGLEEGKYQQLHWLTVFDSLAGPRTPPTSRGRQASCTSRSLSMPSAVGSSAGRCEPASGRGRRPSARHGRHAGLRSRLYSSLSWVAEPRSLRKRRPGLPEERLRLPRAGG